MGDEWRVRGTHQRAVRDHCAPFDASTINIRTLERSNPQSSISLSPFYFTFLWGIFFFSTFLFHPDDVPRLSPLWFSFPLGPALVNLPLCVTQQLSLAHRDSAPRFSVASKDLRHTDRSVRLKMRYIAPIYPLSAILHLPLLPSPSNVIILI